MTLRAHRLFQFIQEIFPLPIHSPQKPSLNTYNLLITPLGILEKQRKKVGRMIIEFIRHTLPIKDKCFRFQEGNFFTYIPVTPHHTTNTFVKDASPTKLCHRHIARDSPLHLFSPP